MRRLFVALFCCITALVAVQAPAWSRPVNKQFAVTVTNRKVTKTYTVCARSVALARAAALRAFRARFSAGVVKSAVYRGPCRR